LITLVKIGLALGVVVLLGLPIVELWKMLVLLLAWVVLACSSLRLTRSRVVLCLAVATAALAAGQLLPRAAIEEGHNIFLVTGDTSVLRSGLPAMVYERWRQEFERQYPPKADSGAEWRKVPAVTLYTPSSDALWTPARFSRRVDAIDFRTLSEFRGGFANDLMYNFFGTDAIAVARGLQADLPFFVRYELSPASVGSALHWRGTVYWERSDGSFEEIAHGAPAGRVISAGDVFRSVYALHLPRPHPPLEMHLELGPALKAARFTRELLGALAVAAVVLLLTAVDRRRLLVALALTACGFAITATAIHFSEGKYLGATYPPHGGGDDGIAHESRGRTMARQLMTGNWREALRGDQSVYFDTPGMRYVRFVERLIFGETNLGYAALVLLLPWFVYLLAQRLTGTRWAVGIAAFFLMSPFGSLSYVQYIQNAKLGYGETIGFAFFILGLYLLVSSQVAWGGGTSRFRAFCGGLCLAGAMFVRPNLAIAVPLLGLLFVVASWRSRDYKTLLAATAGLAFAVWMPLHNFVYGDQFVLISAAGATISLPLGPSTYAMAAHEAIFGNFHGEHVLQVGKQISGWLFAQPRIPVASLAPLADGFLFLRLVTLALTCVVAVRGLWRYGNLSILAWTAVAAHLPMLFVFASAQFRYAMIGWDLCAIVTLVTVAEHASRRAAVQLPPGVVATAR
jgi:hypothetical protein